MSKGHPQSRQQIIDIERDVQQLAIQRREEREQEANRLRHEREQERLLYLHGPFMPQRLTSSRIRDQEGETNQQHISTIYNDNNLQQSTQRQEDERRPHPTVPQMPSSLENISTNSHPEAGYSQQITDILREVEQRRQEERRPLPNAAHMPFRLTTPTRLAYNSSSNYPFTPPMSQESNMLRHLRWPDRPHPTVPQTPSSLDNISTNSHQEAGYSQQITDILREVEQRRQEEPVSNAAHMPFRLNIDSTPPPRLAYNSSSNYPFAPPMSQESDMLRHLRWPDRPHPTVPQTPSSLDNILINSHQEAGYSQQITDILREVEQRRHEEPVPNAAHMPFRLNIGSTPLPRMAYNSNSNYPFAPPMSPESDMLRYLRLPDRPGPIDDGLPTYEEAIAYTQTSIRTQPS